MSNPVDLAGMTEAALHLELQRQKEKAEAERENSLQEEVNSRLRIPAASLEQNS